MELEAAREILAEVFGIRLSEVDEMIQSRFQNSDKKCPGEDDGLWPQEIWVDRRLFEPLPDESDTSTIFLEKPNVLWLELAMAEILQI